jgi:hypothetical protein
MDSTTVAPNSTVPPKPELPTDLGAARLGLDAMPRSSTGERRPSVVRRGSRRLSRSLIVFCTGIGATLAWQAYGDGARNLIANSWPQLEWLAPATESLPQTTPEVQAPAAASTALPEVQQLAGAIESMRQSVDQLATQLVASQRKVADDMAKLHSDQQVIVRKLSTAAARAAAAPARNPAPATAPAPASTSASASTSAPASTSAQAR